MALLTVVSAPASWSCRGAGAVQRFQSDRVQRPASRVPIWETTLSSSPTATPVDVLLGHGFDSSSPLVRSNFVRPQSTHDAYLEMLYEFGMVGLGAFVLMHLLLLCERCASGSRRLRDGRADHLPAGGRPQVNAPDGFMYWIALGFVIASGYLVERASPPPARPEDTP